LTIGLVIDANGVTRNWEQGSKVGLDGGCGLLDLSLGGKKIQGLMMAVVRRIIVIVH